MHTGNKVGAISLSDSDFRSPDVLRSGTSRLHSDCNMYMASGIFVEQMAHTAAVSPVFSLPRF